MKTECQLMLLSSLVPELSSEPKQEAYIVSAFCMQSNVAVHDSMTGAGEAVTTVAVPSHMIFCTTCQENREICQSVR